MAVFIIIINISFNLSKDSFIIRLLPFFLFFLGFLTFLININVSINDVNSYNISNIR
jgi:hypothetical protein